MHGIYPKWFNGIDLGRLGLITDKMAGIHDLAAPVDSRVWLPGRDIPSDIPVRRDLVSFSIPCVLAAPSHDELIEKLALLKSYTSPDLGFRELIMPDYPGRRFMAHSLGFSISIDELPYYLRWVRWDWRLERYPWTEDAMQRTVDITGLDGTVDNSGTMEVPARFTCTCNAALGSLSLSVGGETFTYDAALANTDVLVVDTDLGDVRLNDAVSWGPVTKTSLFPQLTPGPNTITKSTDDYDLTVAFRRRWL